MEYISDEQFWWKVQMTKNSLILSKFTRKDVCHLLESQQFSNKNWPVPRLDPKEWKNYRNAFLSNIANSSQYASTFEQLKENLKTWLTLHSTSYFERQTLRDLILYANEINEPNFETARLKWDHTFYLSNYC